MFLERRKQLALALLAIFAFQCSEALFKKLITIEEDPSPDESDEHYRVKFPTIKLLKPFNLFEKKKEKLEQKIEKKEDVLGELIEKKLLEWEAKKEKFDDKLLEVFDLFKEKEAAKLEKKDDKLEKLKELIEDKKLPKPAPAYEPKAPTYALPPAPHYQPTPAPAPHYQPKHAPPAPTPAPYAPAPYPAYHPPAPAPAPAYRPPAPSPYYAPVTPAFKKHKSYRPYSPAPTPAPPSPRRYCEEEDSSEEHSYGYKPMRPVKPPTSAHCPDYDYEVRYFT
ncbi:PREDICTED: extensin-like [Rhagoletis zephyria]|uniref:extensin-like n=1 Tax=Rhagoletis zephyria TaxID=28612 RepID=UPI0008112DBE|nr:PREDICTED: extensin-like [Rhagoletis zephyria]